MDALRLNYPVRTPDKQLLLPAGTVLSKETLEKLISSRKTVSSSAYPLFSYGTLRNDLFRQMKRSPYDVIFSGDRKIEEVTTMLDKVPTLIPVLQALDYFKVEDYHTYCHSLMVFALAALISRDLLSDDQEWTRIISAGPTHDIGKVCVPLQILKKATPLTRAERSMLDHHILAGYVLLSYFHGDPEDFAAIMARDHHERKDGSGKPRGIQIVDRAVEIVVACDVYDALISPRPYRPVSYDNRTALDEITKMAEMNKIGWDILQALIAHSRKEKPKFDEVKVSSEKRGTPPSQNVHGIVDEKT
jgi:HD-GYP domain-containing protein (c-di-GMP phosphodiesterase class II)